MSTCEDCGYRAPMLCAGCAKCASHETQESICVWADKTFGASKSNAGLAARANQEMSELLMELTRDDSFSGAPEEAADVFIVLMRLFENFGTTWQDQVDRKMKINQARKWHLDGSGHGYHVEETDEDDGFRVEYSTDEKQCVGLCSRFPPLSYFAATANDALEGIKELVRYEEQDLVRTPLSEIVNAAAKRFGERPIHRASIEARAELADDRITCLTCGDFTAVWSDEDGEYVGTCSRYPALSWLDPDPYNALYGIQSAVRQVELDDRP